MMRLCHLRNALTVVLLILALAGSDPAVAADRVPGEHFWRLIAAACLPGAPLLAFGGTRTHHRLACAIEDAGGELRDTVMWMYGSGFPKSSTILCSASGMRFQKPRCWCSLPNEPCAGSERRAKSGFDRPGAASDT